MRSIRPYLLVVGLLLSLVVSPRASAGRTLLFDDGRTLEVESVTRDADMATVALEGGGSFMVAAARISNWDDLARQRRVATTRVQTAERRRAAVQSAAPDTARGYHDIRASESSSLWRRAAGKWADVLAGAASRHDVDPALLTAVAHVESRFDPKAISPKGARGLLQLMPATAKRFGVENAFDVAENVEGGARYLKWLLEHFEGNAELAIAGYNAGERAVERYNGIPPYAETRTYVARVMNQLNRFNAGTTAR